MRRIVEAHIEIPMGSRNKYEVDVKTDRILDQSLERYAQGVEGKS